MNESNAVEIFQDHPLAEVATLIRNMNDKLDVFLEQFEDES